MWLNIIGFILCSLGGGMISKVVARIDDNDKEVILSCFAIIFIMIGAMAMVLALLYIGKTIEYVAIIKTLCIYDTFAE